MNSSSLKPISKNATPRWLVWISCLRMMDFLPFKSRILNKKRWNWCCNPSSVWNRAVALLYKHQARIQVWPLLKMKHKTIAFAQLKLVLEQSGQEKLQMNWILIRASQPVWPPNQWSVAQPKPLAKFIVLPHSQKRLHFIRGLYMMSVRSIFNPRKSQNNVRPGTSRKKTFISTLVMIQLLWLKMIHIPSLQQMMWQSISLRSSWSFWVILTSSNKFCQQKSPCLRRLCL